MVESIHMKQRKMAIPFVLKSRNAKDRHIESNFKNFLEELSHDVINYGHDLILRKTDDFFGCFGDCTEYWHRLSCSY